MPKAYESTATLVAPKEGAGSNILSGIAMSGLIQQVPACSCAMTVETSVGSVDVRACITSANGQT